MKNLKKSIIILLSFCFLNIYAQNENILENNNLKIETTNNGSLLFLDKQNNTQWGSNYPGWVEISDNGHKENISLSNTQVNVQPLENQLKISFTNLIGNRFLDSEFKLDIVVTLFDDYFEIVIDHLKTKYKLETVEYPAHMLSVKSGISDSYIVAPNLQGIIIPSRYDAGFMRYGQNIWDMIADVEKWWMLESGNLNMPWFGAKKSNSSVLAYIPTSSDCMLHLIGNKLVKPDGKPTIDRQGKTEGERLSSLSPIWHSSMKELAYKRKMRIELVDDGYVGMAKRYKEYAKQNGRYVTMKEKIAENPEYAKIIGAPDIKIYCYTNRKNKPELKAWSEPVLNGYSKVNTTFAQVEIISNELKAMGVDKSLILLAGWNRMGYDREHVDMWPPAEKCGGIAGLKKAAKTVRKNGYLFGLHDNYDDFYPDAPSYDEKYILRHADGSLNQGGIWDGGICYIICTKKREELLNRNMALIERDIPLNAYYFDVITNTSHEECYDERHPMTRKEDLEERLNLLKNITDRGLVIGGERGTDWALGEVAFCEGLHGGGTGYHRGVAYRTGITIPLFYLVYHESVVGYWQHGTPYGREDHANHILMDILNAQPSSWSIEYEQWEDLKPLIKDTYDLLNPLHTQTAHAAMIDHQVLSTDYLVQKSTYEDGTECWVNYGITTFTSGTIEIPPKGFRIKMNNEVKTGSFNRSYEIELK